MKKWLLITGFGLFLSACSDHDKVPGDILPKQQMQAVLWDMIRADEFLDGYVFPKNSAIDKKTMAVSWYDSIYKLHRVTRAGFEKSYAWYRQHPAVMKEVLDSLGAKKLPSSVPPGQASSQRDSLARRDSQNKRRIIPGKGKFRSSDSFRRREILKVTER